MKPILFLIRLLFAVIGLWLWAAVGILALVIGGFILGALSLLVAVLWIFVLLPGSFIIAALGNDENVVYDFLKSSWSGIDGIAEVLGDTIRDYFRFPKEIWLWLSSRQPEDSEEWDPKDIDSEEWFEDEEL